MKCPHCGNEKSRVTETRAATEADRRIRLCQGCGKTFQTLERVCVFAGRAVGYIEAGSPTPEPAPAQVIQLQQDRPAARVRAKGYTASANGDWTTIICAEAQPLLLEWWNKSRRSKHGSKATWTEAAWMSAVARVSKLPDWQQVLLAKAGIESGWQTLKPEFIKDELNKPSALGRPRPKDPAMLAALEQWPTKAN